MVFLVWVQDGILIAQERGLKTFDVSFLVPPGSSDSLTLSNLREHQSLPRWYDFVGNVPNDLEHFASISIDPKNIPVLAGLSGLTVGLVVADANMYKVSSGFSKRSRTVSSCSDFFVLLGDGRSDLAVTGLFGLYGFVASDHRALRVASQTLEALVVTGLVVQTFKHLAGRESPGVASSRRGTWRPFPSLKTYDRHQSKYYAFPSGHIATTTATLTVLSENYPELVWMKPVGYALTGLVGIGLVNKGWHWYSDLPLGMALGYTFGRIVSHPFDTGKVGDPGEVKLSLAPIAMARGDGLSISLQF